jgi:hypothetical protein
MRFADVVSMRDEALGWVTGRLAQGAVCGYELQGGGKGGARAWRAVGFFSEAVNGRRVVFEALYPAEPGCLLRVYREAPLEYLSTTRVQDRTTDAHMTAARVFVEAVSNTSLRDVVAEQQRRRRSFPPEVMSALYPVPPPDE